MPYGIQSSNRIIKYRSTFFGQLTQHVSERDLSLIEGEVYSIDHKLNVARYCAGLLSIIEPNDYVQRYRLHDSKVIEPIIMEYPECLRLYSFDEEQFFLSVLFCLETFAASTFSLFDTCGQMITKLYDLQVNGDKNFVNVTNELNNLSLSNIYDFLSQYKSEGETISWVHPLRKIRNHTTHRNITEIINMQTRVPLQSFGNQVFLDEFFFSGIPHKQNLHLRKYADQKNRELRAFVHECFDGLEDFVEKLYKAIAIQIEHDKHIPLSGLYDSLVNL